MYKKYGKRVIDCILAIFGLIICSIPMLVIAILIKLDSPGPVIFKQKRLGKYQKVFVIYKFRTMVVNAYEMGGIVNRSDDKRITRVGSFLRRMSLDELPQIINILKGDMAIIGPRPILKIEFEEFKDNAQYCERYNVLPGLFCTVDIKYRASADRNLQFKMDYEYVHNITFINDITIFFRIIRSVISGKNVYRNEVS